MSVLIRSRWFMLFTAVAVAIATCGVVVAKQGGNGDGGTPPPVFYALHRFVLPFDYEEGFWKVEEINDVGELVGHYDDNDGNSRTRQPFYLDTNTGSTIVTNLNDVQFDEGFGVPVGWYISRANGINNLGDIAGGLAQDGDPERMQGCIIEMRPDPLDLTVKPRIHLIPDGIWSRTYARRINDVGVILGRGDAETAYVYQATLHGQPGDDSVTTIPTSFDAWSQGFLTNPVNGGPTLVKAVLSDTDEILTYNVDAETSSFTDVSNLKITLITGFNDVGSFCGRSPRKGRTSIKGFFYDGVYESLNAMLGASYINDSGDVIGRDPSYRPVIHLPEHGSVLLDEVIVAENEQEQAIWDNSGGDWDPTLSTGNAGGFPVVAGTLRRLDGPYTEINSNFHDGYYLTPISSTPTPGIRVTPTNGLTTTEAGGQDSFDVVLETQPTANVVIAISSSNSAEGTVDKTSLTFTSANWDTPQTVTVTGVDDLSEDGDVVYTIVTAFATSADPDYDGLDADEVSVTNEDDDGPVSGNETYSSGDINLAIPDNDSEGVASHILVGSHTITNLTVNLGISHPRSSDLNVYLIGPDGGPPVQLFNFSGDNNVTDFNGTDSVGLWTLEVYDTKKKKTGTLNSWAITVDY